MSYGSASSHRTPTSHIVAQFLGDYLWGFGWLTLVMAYWLCGFEPLACSPQGMSLRTWRLRRQTFRRWAGPPRYIKVTPLELFLWASILIMALQWAIKASHPLPLSLPVFLALGVGLLLLRLVQRQLAPPAPAPPRQPRLRLIQ